MEIRLLTDPEDLKRYGEWIRTHPEGSLWQSPEWKTYQESLGRQVRIYAAMEGAEIRASALVVIDHTTFGLTTWEIPRGPLGIIENGKLRIENKNFLEKIIRDAKDDRCLSIYCSPVHPFSILNSQFSISRRLVMPEATRIIDLTLSEEDLLAQMKPKGRYNIRLAEKHGVRVMPSSDVQAFARLAEETARRDGFRGHSAAFYERFLTCLPGAFLLFALPPEIVIPSSSLRSSERIEGAGLLGVIWGKTGIYYYGASSHAQKELMAPYLLQWSAMKHCKAHGCTSYDLFGIAPEGAVDHPWSGVSDFKVKFGGSVVNYPPEQEIALRPFLKYLLKIKRGLV
ncbi:MAG: peptidoglycan bridge formation glycyltransferase FemA/FemB family protein [Candidatus Peribacteraceae bacterium]|nr:peptidoglycan bridge formation glycyltransferase FemA/FemB family protein [Candidatus Peribacteraceae bacterium]